MSKCGIKQKIIKTEVEMKELYEKSIQAIKDAPRQMKITEYNQLAKEKGLLSSESLKYISKKSFVTLCKEVRRDNRDI